MARVAVTDMGGSLNQGRPESQLALGEYVSIRNFYQFGGKLRRRGGMRRITDSAYSERVTGMLCYRPDPQGFDMDMLVGSLTSLAILAGDTITAVPNDTGFNIPSSTKRWSMFQFKNIAYGIREDVGLVRTDGTVVGEAGIEAPASAPVLAQGAAGDIPAATFRAVYTFYNADTGMESNPSPVSSALTLPGSTMIDWSGIAVSTNAQVTSRRIYRSLPDQTGEYFLVAEIENNTDTTYADDNVLAQDLDVAVSQVNGTPPDDLLMGTVWKERVFASDGKILFHSEDGLAEAFDPDAEIPVFPDDGHHIRALHAFGDRLIIGKTNKIHYLVGSDPDSFALLTLSDRHGCVSHHSMQSAEGHLFWLGHDNVYRSDGNTVTGIASVKLKTIIEGMDADAAEDAFATVFPTLGWYVLVIPGYTQLIYNYRTDVWTTVPTASDIQMIGDFFDTNHEQEMWVADDAGHVYQFHDTDYGFDDTDTDPESILAAFTGRAFTDPGTKQIVLRALLLTPQYDEDVTIVLDAEDATATSRDVSLNFEPKWKVYSLSTRSQAKSNYRFRLIYTGETAIEIEGYALDFEPLGRPTMLAR